MGKTVLTTKQVLAAVGALSALQEAKAGGRFKLKLARAAAVLRADQERIQQVLGELQRAHVELDEKGNPMPVVIAGTAIKNTVQWKDKVAYDVAEKELLDAQSEFELPPFAIDEIESLEIEGSIEGILPLIR